MEFKEFFKFGWRKVIFSIVIFVLGFLSTVVGRFSTRACSIGGPPCQQSLFYYILKIIGYILIFPSLILDNINKPALFIGLILTIPYVYLLACILDLIIKKVIKKTK